VSSSGDSEESEYWDEVIRLFAVNAQARTVLGWIAERALEDGSLDEADLDQVAAYERAHGAALAIQSGRDAEAVWWWRHVLADVAARLDLIRWALRED
jgi:hypothetical protein